MTDTNTTPEFQVGDVVELQSDPNRRLTVIAVDVVEEDDMTGEGQILVGHFTDGGEFEEFTLPAAALRKA